MKTKNIATRYIAIVFLLTIVSALFVSAPKLARADTGQWIEDVHTVTFITGEGASVVEPQYVEDGRLATRPQDPTRQGYNFVDWYTERYTFSHVFDFKVPIIRDVDVYAKWDKIPEPTPEPTPTPVVSSGWYEDGSGWYFISEDGVRLTNAWAYLNTSPKQEGWYCFDTNGYLRVNGWIRNTNRTWSYVDENGRAYAGGWYFIGGYWYYFDGNGIMLTGWIWDNSYSSWFYCDGSGHMIQGGWAQVGSHWYYFWGGGAMGVGWICYDYHGYGYVWSYCYENGQMAVNTWLWDDFYQGWYYFILDGEMLCGIGATIGGKNYYFLNNGKMCIGWALIEDVGGWASNYDTVDAQNWVYCDSSGVAYSGWLWYNGAWYYFNSRGQMVRGQWVWDDNCQGWFFLDIYTGAMVTGGWHQLRECYVWYPGNGFWYYFYPDGKLATNSYIDGYWVDSNGRWW